MEVVNHISGGEVRCHWGTLWGQTCGAHVEYVRQELGDGVEARLLGPVRVEAAWHDAAQIQQLPEGRKTSGRAGGAGAKPGRLDVHPRQCFAN